MTDRPINGLAVSNLKWLLASVFTISIILASGIITIRTSQISAMKEDVEENTEGRIKHESDIGYIKDTVVRIEDKIDDIIRADFSFKQ